MTATCVVDDCSGHADWTAVIAHAAGQILLDLRVIRLRLDRILRTEETIMADVDQLTADFEQFQTDVTTAVDELKTELANALANQGGIPQAVQAKLDALDQAITSADESLSTPPAPAPQPPAGP